MNEALLILLAAYLLDFIFGDPVYPLHPIRLIGQLISLIEGLFKKIRFYNVISGGLLIIVVVAVANTIFLVIEDLSGQYAFIIQLYLVYSMIAGKDLIKHANCVSEKLRDNNILKARLAVSRIVGRDTTQLNDEEIAKATIESVAENYTDGVLSPIFWYVFGLFLGFLLHSSIVSIGVVFMITFKVISTLDSMIGYRNKAYEKFGKISARLDDVLNFVPARISIVIISISAFCIQLDYKKAWQIGCRDRLKHKSPNAGHSEATVAGALGIKLGGDAVYSFGKVKKPILGDGELKAGVNVILQSTKLIQLSGWLSVFLFSICILIVNYLI